MAGLERLQSIERRGEWNIIVDELPSPVFHDPVSLHENRQHLLRLFHEQPWNAAYTLVSASDIDTAHVTEVARNRFGDRITEQVSDVANKLLSGHWHCFVLNDQLARFKAPGEAVRDWEAKLTPAMAEGLRRRRRGHIGKSWSVDETYIKVHGHWRYLYPPLTATVRWST
jgi:hypothetical protein